MTMRSWITRLFARSPRTTRKSAPRFRPQVEALEARDVPSTTLFTSASAPEPFSPIHPSTTVAGTNSSELTGVATNPLYSSNPSAFQNSSQTISFGPLDNQTYGATVTLSATASSNLPVNFTVKSGPATLSGNVLSLTGVGTVVVEATQAGNGTYSAATPVDQSFVVSPATLHITAHAESKVSGTSDPPLFFSVRASDLHNGDTANVLSGRPSRAAGEALGSYAINQGTLSAGSNYRIVFTGSTLTITLGTPSHLTPPTTFDIVTIQPDNNSVTASNGNNKAATGNGNNGAVTNSGSNPIQTSTSVPPTPTPTPSHHTPTLTYDIVTNQPDNNTVTVGNGNNGAVTSSGNNATQASASVPPTPTPTPSHHTPTLTYDIVTVQPDNNSVTAGNGNSNATVGNGNNGAVAKSGSSAIQVDTGAPPITTPTPSHHTPTLTYNIVTVQPDNNVPT